MVKGMEAEKKLEGAAYHFRKMEELYLKNEDNFNHELEAFLVKVRSVPDVLLEDFNKKFALGISLEEKLYPEVFEQKAQQQKKERAIVFIEWWENNMKEIKESFGMLFSKRDISVHRKQVIPDLTKINLYEAVIAHAEVTVEIYDKKGNLIETKSTDAPPKIQEQKPATIEWCFMDYPKENVIDVSRKLLDRVGKLVEEAKTRFSEREDKVH